MMRICSSLTWSVLLSEIPAVLLIYGPSRNPKSGGETCHIKTVHRAALWVSFLIVLINKVGPAVIQNLVRCLFASYQFLCDSE